MIWVKRWLGTSATLAYGYHPQDFTDMELIEEEDREYDLGERMSRNISKAKEIALATQNQQCIQDNTAKWTVTR
jgi:hypothetical protein